MERVKMAFTFCEHINNLKINGYLQYHSFKGISVTCLLDGDKELALIL
jgi:hypothetical protein